eukprot:648759-Amorphochlora_amoeboformis.AAC.1
MVFSLIRFGWGWFAFDRFGIGIDALGWIGSVWAGLVWVGSDRLGLVWFGLGWIISVWTGLGSMTDQGDRKHKKHRHAVRNPEGCKVLFDIIYTPYLSTACHPPHATRENIHFAFCMILYALCILEFDEHFAGLSDGESPSGMVSKMPSQVSRHKDKRVDKHQNRISQLLLDTQDHSAVRKGAKAQSHTT